MRRNALPRIVMIALFASAGLAFQAGTDGPYKVLKTAKVGGEGGTDYIYCDTSNDRVYIGSHPTKALMVVDARDGTVLGNIDLGGVPEQTVADGKGIVYQVLQDRPGGVAVVDVKTMKVTKTYPLGDNGGGNGVAVDLQKQIPLAACGALSPGPPPGTPRPAAPAGTPPTPPPHPQTPPTFDLFNF